MSETNKKNTLALLLSLTIFISWAALFEIDQTVRATGQVIPSSPPPLVREDDGGLLSDILIQESPHLDKLIKNKPIVGALPNGDAVTLTSPTEEPMVIDAKVTPTDFGQLHVGQPVSIKFDAYDYKIYGSMKGTLVHIGIDTATAPLVEGASPSHYRIHARPQSTPGAHHLTPTILQPGPAASLAIRTHRRSVLNHLLKLLQQSFFGALNER